MFMWPVEDKGAQWGAALGTGLSGGLGALAEHKVKEMNRNKEKEAYRKAGYPEWLVDVPDAIKKEYVSQYAPMPAETTGAAPTGFQSIANQPTTQTKPILAEGEADFEKPGMRNNLPGLRPIGEEQPSAIGKPMSQTQYMKANPEVLKYVPKERDRQYKAYVDEWHKGYGEQQKAEETAERRRHNLLTETESAEKQEFDFTKDIREARSNVTKNLQRNRDARRLLEKGNFTNPIWNSILNKIPGNVLASLKTFDTKKLEALAPSFLEDIKPIFGPQISDSDIDQMYNAIISATNSKDQNLAIMDMFDVAAKSQQEYVKFWDKIDAANEGKTVGQRRKIFDREWSNKIEEDIKADKVKYHKNKIPKGLKSVGEIDENSNPMDYPNYIIPSGKGKYKKSIDGNWIEGDFTNGKFVRGKAKKWQR